MWVRSNRRVDLKDLLASLLASFGFVWYVKSLILNNVVASLVAFLATFWVPALSIEPIPSPSVDFRALAWLAASCLSEIA